MGTDEIIKCMGIATDMCGTPDSDAAKAAAEEAYKKNKPSKSDIPEVMARFCSQRRGTGKHPSTRERPRQRIKAAEGALRGKVYRDWHCLLSLCVCAWPRLELQALPIIRHCGMVSYPACMISYPARGCVDSCGSNVLCKLHNHPCN